MDNLKKYNDIFCRVLSVDESVLNKNFTFKEVPQWDSVSHLSLISALEDEFDILFESEDILHYGSYENGKRILEKYGVSFKDE
ncbi:MAG: acyl carrier protein [Clostridia bacterium]|nr:acyl carrier protein [Clostridia bacterium]